MKCGRMLGVARAAGQQKRSCTKMRNTKQAQGIATWALTLLFQIIICRSAVKLSASRDAAAYKTKEREEIPNSQSKPKNHKDALTRAWKALIRNKLFSKFTNL